MTVAEILEDVKYQTSVRPLYAYNAQALIDIENDRCLKITK